MSRLYYDQANDGGLEKVNRSQESAAKNYLEKVAKIIPSEIVGAYLAMTGFVPLIKKQELHQLIYYLIFGFCALGTIVYMNSLSDPGKPKVTHILLSFFAFILWAYMTTGDKVFPVFYDSAIASILLIAFSLISGKIPLK